MCSEKILDFNFCKLKYANIKHLVCYLVSLIYQDQQETVLLLMVICFTNKWFFLVHFNFVLFVLFFFEFEKDFMFTSIRQLFQGLKQGEKYSISLDFVFMIWIYSLDKSHITVKLDHQGFVCEGCVQNQLYEKVINHIVERLIASLCSTMRSWG